MTNTTPFNKWRISKGLTCAKVAGELGVHLITVRNWNRGSTVPRGLSRIRLREKFPDCPI